MTSANSSAFNVSNTASKLVFTTSPGGTITGGTSFSTQPVVTVQDSNGNTVPVLGVCVGMQILAGSSDEGKLAGLGWIGGRVKRFDESRLPRPARLPHMGWNDVVPKNGAQLFSGLEQDSRFYFLHSYYFDCASNDNVLATSEYGTAFNCAVSSNNIYGVQFHPEKSHSYGTRLLKNFAEL